MGLPGAGKTTLATALCKAIGGVHLNADEIRRAVHTDLGFSRADRIEHARRMGFWADLIARSGATAVADFICPTEAARVAFGADAFVVFVDRIERSRYADTDAIFERPSAYAVRVPMEGPPEYWARVIASQIAVRAS